MTIVDALGREIDLPTTPCCIVSLVPSLTEWLFALGLDDRIAGITDFCIRPPDLIAHKPKIRGTKNPDRAAILALAPDLIIASKEENRRRDVDALSVAGVPVYVTDIRTVPQAIDELAALAHLLDADMTARPLLDDMRQALAACNLPLMRSRVLALVWREPWMAIGSDTYSGDLIERSGAINVGAELGGRYPRFELDVLPSLKLDRILLLSEPYRFTAADLPPLRTHFGGPIDFVDGELLTWYGPRTGQALRSFRKIFKSSAS